MTDHLTMEQLLALRDGDRSEPGMAVAQQHMVTCVHCRNEVDRLHQRTARLRALPTLSPSTDEFTIVRERVLLDRRQRRLRFVASAGLAAAAALLLTVIGRDLVRPAHLDAEEQLRSERGRSRQLDMQLQAWHPEARVIDGRTAAVVIQLENQIADVDAQLAEPADNGHRAVVERDLRLLQQRVGLMNTLVQVHITNASNVGL